MRFSKINLLAFTWLVFCAGSANAFVSGVAPYNFTMTSTYASEALTATDSVVIDLYVDAAPGLQGFAVALLFNDDGTLTYNPGGSSMPSYILYTGGKGATYLIPNVNPPNYWNGNQQPGKKQVNVEFIENGLGTATASGTNIWIASVAFHVENESQPTNTVDLTLAANGTVVQQYGTDVSGLTTITNPSLVLNLPEPSSALVALGAIGALVAIRTRFGR